MEIKNFKYSANFCEENIWHLCQNPELKGFSKSVLIVSNPAKNCPFRFQKSVFGEEVVWWNYHVILLAVFNNLSLIYDFDSTLSIPLNAVEYLKKTFDEKDHLRAEHLPLFKSITAIDYVDSFFSDRSHMMDEQGNWLSSPPDWQIIGKNKNLPLAKLQDFSSTSEQKIYNLQELEALL